MPDTDTTTIEVSTEVWAALDRRKERGGSFDDVVRRLIEATGVGVGDLAGPHPELEYGDVEEIPPGEDAGQCATHDVITGGGCGNAPTVKQPYRFKDSGSDEWDVFYYCDEHRPDERGQVEGE